MLDTVEGLRVVTISCKGVVLAVVICFAILIDARDVILFTVCPLSYAFLPGGLIPWPQLSRLATLHGTGLPFYSALTLLHQCYDHIEVLHTSNRVPELTPRQ
ncbi:uncharacterized protein F5147DRAFT_707499 [Suillus discolor]|uniref:Uncharacterized protein n=1 Tax=Suillus discolor TaxID=1912936 RepID=A0A9P7F173_9AGAM|nr:uncharacterized protein F5147DRAFT_707499 [Suillus discolor]KAG2102578.1 hypothetical protein F5147DRAFT_707499 [Suillus discolor]